jgi:hypothetical protein
MGIKKEYKVVAVDAFGQTYNYTFSNEHSARRTAYEWKRVNSHVKILKNGDTIYEHNPV